jgi:hypothetical protein
VQHRSDSGLEGCAMGFPLEIAHQQRRLQMISFANDPNELKGRRALVTEDRGIGGAIVRRLLSVGARVVAVARNPVQDFPAADFVSGSRLWTSRATRQCRRRAGRCVEGGN